MALFQKNATKATRSLKSMYSQAVFLKRLGHLLLEGLSMQQALRFLSTTGDNHIKAWVSYVQSALVEGRALHDILKDLNFSDQVCSQIYFSIIHGQFAQTIYDCGVQTMERMERRKNLQQVLTYPMMLVVFMVGMLFAMRYILLPHITQLTTSSTSHMSFATELVLILIRESPIILTVVGLLTLVGILLFRLYLSEKTAIERTATLSKLPLVKPLMMLYYTQFLAMEWGQLIKHGTNLKEITDIMKSDQTTPLVTELGEALALKMQQGLSFRESISDYDFFKYELRDIIEYGEQSSDLGKELLLYAKQCEEELSLSIEKLMTYVQPVVFIGIGILIVSIYAALLLPTFSLLNGI